MESLAKIVEQHPIKLSEQLQEVSAQQTEISIYKGELTLPCIAKNVARIQKAFPALPAGFYEILSERIAANGFSDERLADSVSHVINTCVYPTPTIAQFVSYDKKIKTYKYSEVVRMVEDGDNMDNYHSFQFKDRPVRVWIHKNDVALYKITE